MYLYCDTAMLSFSLTKRLPTGGSCILNTFRTGHVARHITQVTREKIFFNRKRELAKFKDAFSSDPELHVVLGPPSTGKTALIHEVTSKGNFSPLFINCREGQFDTPESIYYSIYSQFKPFLDKNMDSLETKKFRVSYSDLSVEYEHGKNSKTRVITSNDVRKLLNDISDALPNWTFWSGYNTPPPILVIDEANMFNQLGRSEEGEILLKSILNWLVVNTKEKKRFHAVLTSSDSFFFNWIVNLLHIPHATPYVVGDLSKEEAEEYFEKQVLPLYECKELEGKFDLVRRITGTRMLIIDKYVKEYKISGGKLKDSRFSIYESEYFKLVGGLYPDVLNYPDKSEPPSWKDYDLIKTMEAIVKAEDQGYILRDDLIKEIGPEKVNSLIDYNFLHCRPTTRFANDIIDPPDEIILTAMNQPSVRAMEHLLSKVSPSKK